jgi:hypothetical protein
MPLGGIYNFLNQQFIRMRIGDDTAPKLQRIVLFQKL